MAFYTPPSLPRTPISIPMSWPTPPMSSTFTKPSLPPIAHLERQLAARAPLTPPEDVFPTRLTTNNEEPLIREQEFALSLPKPYTDWLDMSRSRPPHYIAERTCEMICYLWFATAAPEQSSYPTPSSSPPFSQRPNPATTTLQLCASATFVSFMQKLLETTQVSHSVIVLSLHYIYRLKDRNRFTPAQPGSEFRIAVAGLMMANKFLDDNTYTNKTWSEVSGIELSEINRMEKEFLMGVDFNLYVDKSTYESWTNLLKGLLLAKERDSRHFRRSRPTVRAARHAIQQHAGGSVGPASRTYTSSRYRAANHRARSTSPSQTRRPSSFALPPVNPPSSQPPQQYQYHYHYSQEPTSPSPAPALIHPHANTSLTSRRSGSKRNAETAFSPLTAHASYSQLPSKRPVATASSMGLSLQIPEFSSASAASNSHSASSAGSSAGGANSHSPLEGLQSFATMSLGSPRSRQRLQHQHQQHQHQHQHTQWTRHVPETLVAPYTMTDEQRTNMPQNLYFYTLSSSPVGRKGSAESTSSPLAASRESRMEVEGGERERERTRVSVREGGGEKEREREKKARLRYHQAPQPNPPPPQQQQQAHHYPYYHPAPPPAVVQSASTSPMNMGLGSVFSSHHPYGHGHGHGHGHVSKTIPSVLSTTQGQQGQGQGYSLPHFNDIQWTRPPAVAAVLPPLPLIPPLPPLQVQPPSSSNPSTTHTHNNNKSPNVPSAPFANAGPSGVQFYSYSSSVSSYPTPLQGSSSLYPPPGGWVRRRS